MGQNTSSSESESEEDEVPRFDVFGELPPELQIHVLKWIIHGKHAQETVGAMFEVNQRWFHMLDSVVYPKTWPGKELWAEMVIESDCIRTEIRRIQRGLRGGRPQLDEGAEKALTAAATMYTSHIMWVACHFKRKYQTLERRHLRSALLVEADQSPEMTESVYGPNSAEERQKRRRVMLETVGQV